MLGYLNEEQNLCKGYFENGEESSGFAKTGDLGEYDEEGTIIYVDRLKEIIK